MGEFFKILIEEPARLLKFVFFIVKFLLNVCFTYVLYTWSIGTPTLIDYKDINGIFSFIVSGKIFIPIIFYFISEVFFFQLLSGFSMAPFDRLTKNVDFSKPDETLIKVLRWGLIKAKIISIDTTTNATSAGEKTNLFHDLLVYYETEGRNEIHTIRHSLVNKVMQLYSMFLVLFIFWFNFYTKNNVFNIIVIIISVILPLLYIEIHLIVEFLNKNSKDLLFGLNQLKFQKALLDYLQIIGLTFLPLDINDNQSPKYITFNNKDYFVQLYHFHTDINEKFIENCTKLILKTEKNMILITSNELSKSAEELAMEYKNSIAIIKFENENDLVMKLEGFFKKKY